MRSASSVSKLEHSASLGAQVSWVLGHRVQDSFVPDVSRDSVARFDFYHVSGNKFSGRYCFALRIPNNLGSWRAQGPKRVHGFLGAKFLEEANADIQGYHGSDDAALYVRRNAEADGHCQNEHLQNWIRNDPLRGWAYGALD